MLPNRTSVTLKPLMPLPILYIRIMIAGLGLLSCSQQACLAAPAADLKFSIILDKNEYNLGDPVFANFKLQNKGRKPVYVNKRFYINCPDQPKESKEISLLITSPSTKKLACNYSYRTGFPKSEYFELLEPGKEITSEWKRDLRTYFNFDEAGIYKITAIYENVYGKEIGLDAFRDKLTSTVSLKIVKPESNENKRADRRK